MPFDQSTITEIFPPVTTRGQVYLSWTSSSPAGTPAQVYLDGELAWSGVARSCWLAIPAGVTRVELGEVEPGEESLDFNGTAPFGSGGYGSVPFGLLPMLPPAPARRAVLAWQGGSYLGSTLAGFRVYGEPSPGNGISYAAALADITAYPQGIATDGFGLGAFGSGGMGQTAGAYGYTSEPLTAGTWSFAVRPYDAAGNLGAAQLATVTIAAPPLAPGLFGDGLTRLRYSLSGLGGGGFGGGPGYGDGAYGSGSYGGGVPFGASVAVLSWNAAG